MDDHDEIFFETIDKAIKWGGSIGGVDVVEAFNLASDHVLVLLEDAYASYQRGSFGTCVFLALSALEETPKAELLGHRSRGGDGEKKKGIDPMRSHADKHIMAVRPTTFMGRLPDILGTETCDRLIEEAMTGKLKELREIALYVHADERGVRAPLTEVSKERAREILLVALESADDVLVGYTNHSFALGERFEAMIKEVA
ncbi:AbiV family abortive infection protein [Rhizobium sp. Kim5]|uniref:AbiV family abortive infection protein n=1 Tax=Rhizobium sp. Kim5 TaxID=2020311 RepID=UPI000A2A0CF6|nr:AbiV family abortive infection protein [Rhizobium sp. Kim5]ARQ56870.1 AbiV family abortive infection protein [Rhizobium sp. Kim5]